MDKLAGAIMVGFGTLSISVLLLAEHLGRGLAEIGNAIDFTAPEHDPQLSNGGFFISIAVIVTGFYFLIGHAIVRWFYKSAAKEIAAKADEDAAAIKKMYEERYGKWDGEEQAKGKKGDDS